MPREIEASVQMRLYTLTKRRFAFVFIVFLLCFLTTVIIGLAGPQVIYTDDHILELPRSNEPSTSFTVTTSLPLNTFNQQLWLLAAPVLAEPRTVEADLITVVSVHSVYEDAEKSVGRVSNHTRHVICSASEDCTELALVHIGYLDGQTYRTTVTFNGLRLLGAVSAVHFRYKAYKTAFTSMELWFRFSFLALTFIITVLFSRSLRPYAWKDWSIEQKWMTFLLPLLLLYNNPLFALSLLLKSVAPFIVDGVFQATFLSALLLFWLCIYHSIRLPQRRFPSFYLPKLVLVGLIWLAAVTLSTWQAIKERTDPTYNFKTDTVNFTGFKIFLFTLAGLYALFLLYLLIRAFIELRNVAYFDMRLKFTTIFFTLVSSISLSVLGLRFGKAALDDNFVSDISTRYSSSAEFLSLYALLNLYIYTMAFVYSPSKNAHIESQLHDNPIVTMLNESDDDIMYAEDSNKKQRNNFVTRFDAESD